MTPRSVAINGRRAAAFECHALNNLAYALAVYRDAPAKGLPFAKRAATLAPRKPACSTPGVDSAPAATTVCREAACDAITLESGDRRAAIARRGRCGAQGDRGKARKRIERGAASGSVVGAAGADALLRERIAALPLRQP